MSLWRPSVTVNRRENRSSPAHKGTWPQSMFSRASDACWASSFLPRSPRPTCRLAPCVFWLKRRPPRTTLRPRHSSVLKENGPNDCGCRGHVWMMSAPGYRERGHHTGDNGITPLNRRGGRVHYGLRVSTQRLCTRSLVRLTVGRTKNNR